MIRTITAMPLTDHPLAHTLDAYRTAEFATLTADGTPSGSPPCTTPWSGAPWHPPAPAGC